jgi:hypothetical protein
MLYQHPAIQSRVNWSRLHLVEDAKGGPSKLLLSFLFKLSLRIRVHPAVTMEHCPFCRPSSEVFVDNGREREKLLISRLFTNKVTQFLFKATSTHFISASNDVAFFVPLVFCHKLANRLVQVYTAFDRL